MTVRLRCTLRVGTQDLVTYNQLDFPAQARSTQILINMSNQTKQIGGSKNGSQRVIPAEKSQKWYPAEDTRVVKVKQTANAPKVRPSLVPGAVLIVLAGKFRGKRVVLLKSLEDNTLLVTGPFKINGVPLRRVNARYVIATSTRVNVSGVKLDKFTPAYFAREKRTKEQKKTEQEFFEEGKTVGPKEPKAERVADQKEVDGPLIEEIKKTNMLQEYLSSSFSLNRGDRPHLLKF